ncbi:MAG: RNA 2'-phosphotransferase [Candidatus Thermoplasmatota archaeon]
MSDLSERYKGLSKHLSYLLRHHPEDGNLTIDDHGFVDLEAVLDSLNSTKHSWASREDIEYLIENSDKKRFEVVGGKVRALYGHSIDVKIEQKKEPPERLYHGTSPDSLSSIFDEGLKPMGRQYVHLSLSKVEGVEVGKRHHPEPVILEIDSLEAWEDGIDFYKRGDLYLSERIPPEYVRVIDERS